MNPFQRIVIVALGLTSVPVLSACRQEKDEREAPRPVLSMIVERTSVSGLSLPGTIEPRIETDLGFRILGRMIARNVSVGDLVKKNEVVAAIDPVALELAVRSAQSDVENGEAQLRNALTTEQRQRALLQSRSGTEATLEEAEQARKTAAATLAKAKANLKKATEQLSYTQLRAEFDGVITDAAAEVGQVVSAGQTVVTIARPESRDAVIDVPQGVMQQVKLGSKFEVSLQLDHSVRTSGVVREITPEAETTTRTRRTKIELADPPIAFRLGSVVTASESMPADQEIMIPSSAILSGSDEPAVWVVSASDRKLVRRRVKVDGEISESRVRIANGLAPGERLVVAGVHQLQEGQVVRVDQGDNQ